MNLYIYFTIFCNVSIRDYREEEEDVPRIWPAHHKDDILSISFYSPNLVATSCYNGDLKVWNLDTGHTLCVLNANNFDIPVTSKPVIPLELKRRVSENNAGRFSFSDERRVEKKPSILTLL